MGNLSVIHILDAMKREIEMQQRRGDYSGKTTHAAICKRLIKEKVDLKKSSIRTQVSRYLKDAFKDGYVEKERVGRNTFNSITPVGGTYLIQHQDILDKTNQWFEQSIADGMYMSFAVAKPEWGPLIGERYDPVLQGEEEINSLIRIIKEKNPGVKSLFIRLDK